MHRQTPPSCDRFLSWCEGCQDILLKGEKAPLDGLSAFKHHSPYTREQCVTQWCCQRNQTPFLLHWRRSKSYRHRPLGCPWAGSPVCRQSQQRLGLKEKRHEQYCQPTVSETQASGDASDTNTLNGKIQSRQRLWQIAGKHVSSIESLMQHICQKQF